MHNEAERTILAYVGSDLLELALKYGYQLRGIHEVWGWTETAPIFKEMIADLLIEKLCASPLDKLVMLNMDDDERSNFIRNYCYKLGLDVSNLLLLLKLMYCQVKLVYEYYRSTGILTSKLSVKIPLHISLQNRKLIQSGVTVVGICLKRYHFSSVMAKN